MLLSHPDPEASHGLEHRVGLPEAHGKRTLLPFPLHKVTRLTSWMACLETGGPSGGQAGAHPAPVHLSGVAEAAGNCVLGLELLSRPSPLGTSPKSVLLGPSSSSTLNRGAVASQVAL